MQYYRLAGDCLLRGWKHLTCVLLSKKSHRIQVLDQRVFSLLTLCDGEHDLSEILFDTDNQEILRMLEEKKIVARLDHAEPVNHEQRYQYYNNRYFSRVLWSITGRCNFQCRHCYMDAPDVKLGELPLEELKQIANQLAECGVFSVHLTGGEPLIRKDFWGVVDYLLSVGLSVDKIYTNGWLLTPETLNQFEQRGMRPAISISFDGIGWHDWMRGVQGAEQRTIEAIQECSRRGFPVDVEMCLHRGNLPTLRETIKFLDSIGVISTKISNVVDTECWKRNADGNELSGEAYYRAVMDYIPAFFEDGMPANVLFGSVIQLNKGSTEYNVVIERGNREISGEKRYLCGAARFGAYITPEGRFLPCMAITSSEDQDRFPLIREIGVKRCLDDSYYMNFVGNRVKDLFDRNVECAACEYRNQCCGGCRAQAMLMNGGDLYACDNEACFLFRNGYPDKIRKVADDAIAKYCNVNDQSRHFVRL